MVLILTDDYLVLGEEVTTTTGYVTLRKAALVTGHRTEKRIAELAAGSVPESVRIPIPGTISLPLHRPTSTPTAESCSWPQ